MSAVISRTNKHKKPGTRPGFLFGMNGIRLPLRRLETFEKVASGARDVHAAGDAAVTIFDALYDASRLGALGAIGALGGVHHLLTICCLGNLCHGNLLVSSMG